MKKVLKKFNRTLAIMLAAAMVLTMVPQTAMPVLAAPEAVEGEDTGNDVNDTSDIIPTSNDSQDASDEDGESDSENTEDEVTTSDSSSEGESQSTEKTEDVTEADENENSEDSDTTDDEQIEEKADASEGTPAEEPAEEVVTPSEKSDETEAPEEEEAIGDSKVINSIEMVEPVSVNVEYYEKGAGENGADAEADEENVIIHYIEGVDNGQAAGGSTPVKFRVEANDGWKGEAESDIKVEWAVGTGDDKDPVFAVKSPTNGVYTIPTNGTTGEGKEKKNIYKGDITIKLTAERIKPKLIADTGVKAWLNNEAKTSITEAGVAQDFALFREEVSIAVEAKAADTVKVAVKIDDTSSTAVDCVRTEDTLTIGEGDGAKTYPVYTFNPTVLEGYEENTRNSKLSFIITKTDGVEKTLSFAIDSERGTAYDVKPVPEAAKLADTDDTHYIKVATNNTAPSDTLDKSDYQKTGEKNNVLAFDVTAGANRTLSGVKAELTKENDEAFSKSIDATPVEYTVTVGEEEETRTYYTVSLAEISEEDFDDDLTLTIKAETAFKEATEDFAVHNVEFKGDTANVELKENAAGTAVTAANFSDATDMSTAFSTNETNLYFAIKAKEGYEIAKGKEFSGDNPTNGTPVVTVSYKKVYQLTKQNGDEEETALVEVTKADEELTLVDVASNSGIYKLESDFVLGGDGTIKDNKWKDVVDAETAKNEGYKEFTEAGSVYADAPYSVKDLVINVETETETNQAGKITVIAEEGLSYTVVTGSGVDATEIEGEYTISEEASFVTLNITSPAGVPSVTYENVDESTTTVAAAAGAEGSYSVSIPVQKLKGAQIGANSANSDIDSEITITKASKSFSVVKDTEEGATFDGSIKVGKNNKEPYGSAESEGHLIHKQGDIVPVVLYAADGTEFKTVKIVTGTDKTKQETDVALGEDKSEAAFELTMSDNIKVVVTTNDVYYATLSVKQGSNTLTGLEPEEDGVYDIPVGSKDITATLMKGSTPENIEYAKLYDGSAVAASKVTVTTNTAKITSIDEKDTGVLRLDLTAKVKGKLQVVASLQIRQAKMAEKMAIINEWDGSAQTSLTLEPDSEAVRYKVVAEDGSLAFSNDTILLELTEDETKAGKAAKKDESGNYVVEDAKHNIKATYDTSDRTLEIEALPSVQGGYKGVLRFYDSVKRKDKKIQDDICAVEGGTITVETTAPSLKDAALSVQGLNHTNTSIRLQVSSNAKQPTGANGNKVFYRVSFPTTDTFGANDLKGDRYYLLEEGESQTLDIQVNPPTMKKGKDTVPYSDPKTFHPTVSLVQTTSGLTYADGSYNVAKLNKSTLIMKDADPIEATTKEARYEHTLNLTPAKATVYTGAGRTAVTKAEFSGETGFANITNLEFVDTKTGVRKGTWNDETDVYDYDKYAGLVATSEEDGSVYINASSAWYNKNYPDRFKNLGLKVTADNGVDTTMPASKVLPLTVVSGVGNIAFENGYQQSIYKQPGKAATLKVKAVLNYGQKEYAPKSKKFVYAMGDKAGRLPGEEYYDSPSYEITKNVTVDAKNGTVKVNKDFVVDTKHPENNQFSVVATETYSGRSDSVCITITDAAQSVGKLVIVDSSGNVIAENGVLRADDFYTKDGYTRSLYVRALTGTAQKTSGRYGAIDVNSGSWEARTNPNYMPGVKYTSSAKSALAVDSTNGQLTFLKGQTKPVKLSVAAADGSKSKAQTLEVTVQGFSTVALNIWGQGATSSVDNEDNLTNPTVNYDGAMAAGFYLRPMVKVNGKWVSAPTDYFKNFTIKIGKAKKISLPKTATYWQIVKTDVDSTVTVTDKTNKSVTATYTISQNPPAATKGPKIKSLTKLTQQMVDTARNADNDDQGTIMVRFQINAKDLSSYAGQYMMITPDYTKTKLVSKIAGTEEWWRADQNFLDGEHYRLVQIGGDGVFELPLYMRGMTNEQRIPGNYTLIATVGSYDGGNFKPVAKGTSVKIKIPGKAPKALSLKLNGNFTLDESGSAVDLAGGISSGRDWWLEETVVEGNYAMNKIDPATGQPNEFRKYFKVTQSGGKYWLGLQDGLTLAQIEALRENTTDCEGYVTVETDDQRQDMLIKVTLGDAVMGAWAEDSYVGAETTVKFFASAKSTTPIKLKGVTLDSSSEGNPSFVTGTTINAQHVVKEGEDSVKIKLGAAEAGKSYKVTFRVLAADSAYATAKEAKSVNDAYIASHGRLVTATLKVLDPAKTKNAVTIVPEDEENGLAFTAYSATTYDAKKGIYSLEVTTKSSIAGADVSAAKIAETVKNKPYEGAGIVDIKKNKKDNKFILTLDKAKFVEKADGKTPGKFKRGASVEIPVELTFANSNIASQTVNAKVTLPDPMDIDSAVEAAKAAVADMTTFRVINMTNPLNGDDNYKDPKETLQNWANDAWNHAVPYDTEAAEITRNFKLTDKKTTGENPVTTWEAVLLIKADKKEATPKWTQTLSYAKEEKIIQRSALEGAIAGLTFTVNSDGYIVENGNKVDNDYTADKLREDIVKMLAPTKLPSNLNIIVDDFRIKKATVKADGKVTATIKVYDAVTKQMTDDYDARSFNVTITKLGDLGGNATLITNAIKDKTSSGKIDYQKVIYDALKDATDLSGVEDALKTAITNAANAAKTNSDVQVEFAGTEITEENKSSFDSYDNSHEVGDTIEVGYKLPDESTPGWVKFKLIVKQTGMKNYPIDMTADNKDIDVAATRKLVEDGDPVAIFQTLTNLKTGSASWHSGDNAILASAYDSSDAATSASFKPIDSDDDEVIMSRIKAAVESKITGVGLTVSDVTKADGFTTTADGNTAGEVNADDPVYAKGTITVTDGLGRADDWTFKFVVEIPAKAATVTKTEVTATKTVGNGTAEDVTITGKAINVTEIGDEKQVIAFSPKAVGNWLTDAQKNTFKYTLLGSDDSELTGNKTTDEGVVLSEDGKLTVDPSKVETGKDSTTGLTVKVKMQHNAKLDDSDTIPSDAAGRTETITVNLKFKDAASAAAKLVEKSSGKYNWMPTKAITATIDAKAGGGYEVKAENQATLAKALKDATEAYLTRSGYTGYTVAVKADDPYAATETSVNVTLTVSKGDDTADTDSPIEITAVKSPKTVANELMANVITEAAKLNSNAGLKDTGVVAEYAEADAKALMESELSTTLNGATITVSKVEAGTNKVTVTFTVTPSGEGSVASDSDTLEIAIETA